MRLAALYAVVAAAGAVLVSPLIALSYFATAEGAAELERATVSAWADPAREQLEVLLAWESPERVYAAYWLLFWAFFPAVFLCANAVRSGRARDSRLERWGWRPALFGYASSVVGAVVACVMLVTDSTGGVAVDVAFLALMVPALAADVIGSTILGVALIRRGYKPRLTAWLLALTLPSMVVVPTVLGNLSLGLLPVFIAWGITGWWICRRRAGATSAASFVPTGRGSRGGPEPEPDRACR